MGFVSTMVEKVSISDLRGMAPRFSTPASAARRNHQVMPMFLPTDISSKKGTGVIKVVTRQNFLNDTIYKWVSLHSTLAATVILGIVALLLIPVNLLLAAVAALSAGYFYGRYQEFDYRVNRELKHRWLLEGT